MSLRRSAIWLLLLMPCLQAGCVHHWRGRPEQVESHPDTSQWKKSRVSFRKLALACFHVPLYQLPDGYSSTYRRHLVSYEHSPVVLGQRQKASDQRLAAWSEVDRAGQAEEPAARVKVE